MTSSRTENMSFPMSSFQSCSKTNVSIAIYISVVSTCQLQKEKKQLLEVAHEKNRETPLWECEIILTWVVAAAWICYAHHRSGCPGKGCPQLQILPCNPSAQLASLAACWPHGLCRCTVASNEVPRGRPLPLLLLRRWPRNSASCLFPWSDRLE